ncbi:MAG: phage tail family protein [Chloroflexi bacterium]|nr:phage tail family protein [Chloroflexota bacterium]
MAEWDWTFNGFTWGDDALDVVSVEGLLGMVAESSNVRRSDRGSTPGRVRLPEKTITMEVELAAATSAAMLERLALARAAWTVRQDELPLTFQVKGDIAKRVYCRPVRHAIPITVRYEFEFLEMAVQFEATDPLIYSDDEHSATTAPAQPGAGLTVPFTPPFTVPAATSLGVVSLINAGTTAAPWAARIDGPVTNPVIRHLESGRLLDFSANGGLVIGAGQWVDIATDSRSVRLLGTGDRRITIRLPESRWFLLDPGANTVEFTADTGTGAITISHRDAWAA